MINSNTLMKKIFLFILNILFILTNLISVYWHLLSILHNNYEPAMLSLLLIPVFLILTLIFYFLKNYLSIGKFNRRLPALATILYLTTIVVDGVVVEVIKTTKIIPHNVGIVSPTDTYILVNFILSIILFILSILCTVRSLLLQK